MGQDIAVFGTLALTAKSMATWKKLDCSPATASQEWDFAAASEHRGTVADALAALASPLSTFAWTLKVGAKKVTLRGVLSGDAFADHGRVLALLWMRGGEAGGTGTLFFRGIETSDYGAIVVAAKDSRPRLMTAKEKSAADETEEMEALRAELAEVVAAEAAKKPRAAKKKLAAMTPAELREATESGKNKDRADALAALVSVDVSAGEGIALAWLEPPGVWDERRWTLVAGAIAAAGAIGTRACLERIAALMLESVQDYISFAATKALSSTKGPDVAAAIIATLTDDSLREHPYDAHKLLEILVARGEACGPVERARLAEIARDAAQLYSDCDLPPETKVYWAKAIAGTARTVVEQSST